VRKTTRRLLQHLGVEKLYPIQEAALREKVEYGESLVVSAPTASGKTLVALIGIMNALADNPGSIAVYTAPLRSIAYEKLEDFKKLEGLGFRARLEVGSLVRGPRDAEILVTTYEKLDSILRNRPDLKAKISVLVVDEVHYIGDEKRGPVVETILSIMRGAGSQLIALSATIPNAREIAEWLGARLVESEWRPVPLREGVYKAGTIYYPSGESLQIERVTGSPYVDLIIHYAREGGQSLVFSQSRRRVVQTARQAARFHRYLSYDQKEAAEVARRILESGGPRSLREELAKLVAHGVAFHHAGLSNEQRMIIEDAFRRGVIVSVHATPTLAAGVNLPARAVIVEEYMRYEYGSRNLISVSEYKQLAGRAGRPGYDEVGDAIIIASKSDDPMEIMEYYILSTPEPVDSKLSGPKPLTHALLGLIDAGIIQGREDLRSFASKTFYAYQSTSDVVVELSAKAVKDMEAWGLIEVSDDKYRSTSLGGLVARLYLHPYSVPVARQILERMKAPPGETGLLYLVASMPDMPKLRVPRREEEKLMDAVIEEAQELIDLVDWFGPEELRRIKTTLVLREWINEASEDMLMEAYGVGPGDLAGLVETGEWIASSLARIAEYLGGPVGIGGMLELLSTRIRYGIKPELVPLVTIPGVGRVKARRLYQAGYKTLHDLATASPKELARIPGIGAATARAILEFFGRGDEVSELRGPKREGRGLEAFFD